jgi:ABC-2 type transport system ATP-binding protein
MNYGRTEVLKGVSFDIRPGCIAALVGPNGAGKSTLISLMLGLLQPQVGQVLICGEKGESSHARRRRAFVLQDSFFPYLLPPKDCLRLFAAAYGGVLHNFSAEGFLTKHESNAKRLRDLSGGQRRKILIAAALQCPVDVYILDEPTAMLDAESRHAFWRYIVKLRDMGKTIFFTSHNMEEVEKQADRILLMSKGQIAHDGSLASVGKLLEISRVQFDVLPPNTAVEPILSKWSVNAPLVKGHTWQVFTREPEGLLSELIRQQIDFGRLLVQRPSLQECLDQSGLLQGLE